MKKILLSSLLVGSLFATEQNYIELGAGYANSKDNFSANDKSSAFPYISFYHAYNITKNTNIYLSSKFGDLKLGTNLDTNLGAFDFGLLANFMKEEWENPYLATSTRKKTDTKEAGLYAGYTLSFLNNNEAKISYSITKKTYDKDELIMEQQREGIRNKIAFNHKIHSSLFTRQTTYFETLTLENYKAEGNQNSYKKIDFELGVSSSVNDSIRLSLLANVGQQDYDKVNTNLNQKVSVKLYGAKAILNWDKPLGYDSTYMSFKTGYEKEAANHDFYDKENTFGIVSLGYKF
jgi:hypothetical protein